MNKILKSCFRILGMLLAIILLAGLIWAGIHRDSRVHDIDYDLILFIALSIVLFIFYFTLIYNTFKPQKWTKRILIFILFLILVFLLYVVLSLILWFKTFNIPVDKNGGEIVRIISIILSIYLIILIRIHKIEDKINKKRLKTIILIISPFMVIGVRAGLTRAGVITNFTNLDILNPDVGYSWDYGCYDRGRCVEKPIIYLYPTEEIQVNVTLGTPENLSHTYPKYNSEKGRNVVAQPNGDLENIDTGRKLYALYREGNTYAEDNFEEGFVVKGEDIIPFLEEKLALLGLNEREAEEFIVYWLPQMENNEYNLIRFETKEEQDENMPLNITPEPDTVIRVMMDRKAIDEPIDISEQELTAPERTGFTAVEWGGNPRN